MGHGAVDTTTLSADNMDSTVLANTLGMEFVGFTLATWLFGVNTLQAYIYFQQYNDTLPLKLTAILAIILDVANTAFGAWGIYLQIIPDFGKTPNTNIPLTLQSTIGIMSIFVVQCFLVQSIWRVSRRNKWLTVFIVTLSMLGFAIGLVVSAQLIISLEISILETTSSLVTITLGVALTTLSDVVITASLVGYLFHEKGSVTSASHLLERLISFAVQRGVLITLAQSLVVILTYAEPKTFAWALFQYSLGKIYTYTFFAILNRRDDLRRSTTVIESRITPQFPMPSVPGTTQETTSHVSERIDNAAANGGAGGTKDFRSVTLHSLA
ncbi:hypothetical protein F5I97DRAFT_1899787 [Phlebopus sp. FC_14]|nr:hypothetical protein F5I97DRAFT_1899787 [Phlebopus sp. FC_14]